MIRISLETFNYLVSAGIFVMLSFVGFWCCDVAMEAIKTHNKVKEVLKDETIYH
jgi:hypothetical protein